MSFVQKDSQILRVHLKKGSCGSSSGNDSHNLDQEGLLGKTLANQNIELVMRNYIPPSVGKWITNESVQVTSE